MDTVTPDQDKPTVQWQCDNIREIEEFLGEFRVRMQRAPDDCLMVQGWGGLNILLAPGDCLLLDGDQLGVVRVPTESNAQN